MTEGAKVCTKCGERKQLSDFYRDRRTRDGRTPACAECNRQANARWRATRPTYFRDWNRLHRLGVTPAEADRLLAEQDGLCAICGCVEADVGRSSLALDHCHATGRPRGLLCRRCNTGLGLLGDTEEGLLRALNYLRRSTPSPTETLNVEPGGSGPSATTSASGSAAT